MPAWDSLLAQFSLIPDESKAGWAATQLVEYLERVSARRDGRNVLFYASAWLQKPHAPPMHSQITHEDINGFMTTLHGMDFSKGLTLILHTPGGVTNAAETIVAYLRSKFSYIETIVPTYAMSAGTMISLGTNAIIMGRQSQLGPIDPQLPLGNRFVSAEAIVKQFARAHGEVAADQRLAHVWAPIIQHMGPALLTEAQNALTYGQSMVENWLASRMLQGHQNAAAAAAAAAAFFNDTTTHLSHGRRIDRDEARKHDITVKDLEDDADLQDAVLSAYHIMTILFEAGPASKGIVSNKNRQWIKNLNVPGAG